MKQQEKKGDRRNTVEKERAGDGAERREREKREGWKRGKGI